MLVLLPRLPLLCGVATVAVAVAVASGWTCICREELCEHEKECGGARAELAATMDDLQAPLPAISVPTEFGKSLRCCINCKLIKTLNQVLLSLARTLLFAPA